MLDKKDAEWWLIELEKRPESASQLVQALAGRLALLDKQNEELRGELITLKRRTASSAQNAEMEALRARIRALETALRSNQTTPQALLYGSDRIALNAPLAEALEQMRVLPDTVRLAILAPSARLAIITAESRAFSLALEELPVPPDETPVMLGSPTDIAEMLDETVFEQARFVTLRTERGYVYSMLTSLLRTATARGEKLIRALIPGDPVVGACPSWNGDLLVASRQGRWARFPERSIAPNGSQAINLPSGDRLIGAISLPPGQNTTVYLLSETGRLFARPAKRFEARRVPGTSGGQMREMIPLIGLGAGGQHLTVYTGRGRLRDYTLADMPLAENETGAALPGLAENEILAACTFR